VEFAANVGDYDMVDLNVNAYGNFFNTGLVNAFRNKGTSYDIEGGYSHALFNQSLDLRLKLVGYQYNPGAAVYGWRTGADLTTRDGVFSLRYDHGDDAINGKYDTVGGFVNVGFQLDDLIRGKNPFEAPAPVFNSPRNLANQMVKSVKRDWHQPSSVVIAKSATRTRKCDTTRFFSVFPLNLISGPDVYAGLNSFAPVPYTCLSPTGAITVSFNYDFHGVNPSGALIFIVAVFDSALNVDNDDLRFVFEPPAISSSGDVSMTLPAGAPVPLQNAFVSTGSDPTQLFITAIAPNTTTLDISNVQVIFNQ
jgi:hypothetical protein